MHEAVTIQYFFHNMKSTISISFSATVLPIPCLNLQTK